MNTDVDRPEACTVAGSHVLVERLDSVGAGELTELLVHVVGSRAGVVSEPDTKVLDLERLLLVDLRRGNGRYEAKSDAMTQPVVSLPFRLPLERLQGTTYDLYVQR